MTADQLRVKVLLAVADHLEGVGIREVLPPQHQDDITMREYQRCANIYEMLVAALRSEASELLK